MIRRIVIRKLPVVDVYAYCGKYWNTELFLGVVRYVSLANAIRRYIEMIGNPDEE